MRTISEMLDALGSPVVIGAVDGDGMALARWQHGDTVINTSDTDALRVLLSLGLTQQVRYLDPHHDVTMRSVPGDIAILPAGVASTTVVDGDADILQIFIDPATVSPFVGTANPRRSIVGGGSDELRCALVRLFVTQSLNDTDRRIEAVDKLRRTVAKLLRSDADEQTAVVRGGLSPAIGRRVTQLICTSLTSAQRISVPELAEEARMNVHHFIRAFRQSFGVTPHQFGLATRHQKTLAMLHRGDVAMADISNQLGFSSPAHFAASFRLRFGATPSEYRYALASSTP